MKEPLTIAEHEEIARLIARAREGDTEAFTLLYERFLTPIYRYVFFHVKHKEDAEDLTQAVFLKAFRSMGSFTDRGLPFASWLYTIARNSVFDHWKKRRDVLVGSPEETFGELEDLHVDILGDAMSAETAGRLNELVETLSPDQREIVVLHFMQDLSYTEIAEITGKSEDAIRALKHRAMKELRKRIAGEDL